MKNICPLCGAKTESTYIYTFGSAGLFLSENKNFKFPLFPTQKSIVEENPGAVVLAGVYYHGFKHIYVDTMRCKKCKMIYLQYK